MKFVIGPEVLLDEEKERFTNVGLDTFVERGVEPNYISFSLSSPRCRWAVVI